MRHVSRATWKQRLNTTLFSAHVEGPGIPRGLSVWGGSGYQSLPPPSVCYIVNRTTPQLLVDKTFAFPHRLCGFSPHSIMDPTDEKGALHTERADSEDVKGAAVKEAQVHSVALTEAINAQKPSLKSPSMMKLYAIMGIGVSQHRKNAC